MLFSKSFYYFSWLLLIAVFCLGFLGLCFFLSLTSSSIFLDFSYSSFFSVDFSPVVILTPMSSLFSLVVLLITGCVLVFSVYYMGSSVKTIYFTWFTVLFVFSMLIVINFGDLFSIMLGWDGLGVVSFFLIIYYQSPVSIYSGLITLFMNRLGDGLLLVAVVLLFYTSPSSLFIVGLSLILSFSLLLGLCTKSALFPFSPWLPAAMAAPTPISSLVHSSTLVTAGLYLMFRFSEYFYLSSSICYFICISSVFTSFYAGLNSLVEMDLKKVVALSTLSHLGFIGLSFSLGWLTLAYIHLISHAAFKSLLFMGLGSMMVSSGHYQDSRYLSGGSGLTPLSSSFMLVAVFSLLGFPFLSGFYSKDYILETLCFSPSMGWLQFMVYLNLFFTFSYAMRIFTSVYSFMKMNPMFVVPHYPLALSVSLGLLSFCSVVLISFWISAISPTVIPLPVLSLVKFYPVFLSLFVLLGSLFIVKLYPALPSFVLNTFSSMLFLSNLWANGSSRLFLWLVPNVNKSFEYGILNSTLNLSLSSLVYSLSSVSLSLLTSVYFLLFLGLVFTVLLF